MNVLLDSLKLYYQDDERLKKLIDVQEYNKISLRIIDWFVTNYSKKNNICYTLYRDSNGCKTFIKSENNIVCHFNIFQSYKSQLKSYHKSKFDPFCRNKRIFFKHKYGELETTIGQLNFFKWAIDNLVIDYISQHYKEIEYDMNENSSNVHKKKNKNNSKERKKRQELSKSASRGLNVQKNKVILEFN
tara:strand:+ start:3384 stop:3947 length:564 start_codon:yes stop_codon:yes gene_type:complete